MGNTNSINKGPKNIFNSNYLNKLNIKHFKKEGMVNNIQIDQNNNDLILKINIFSSNNFYFIIYFKANEIIDKFHKIIKSIENNKNKIKELEPQKYFINNKNNINKFKITLLKKNIFPEILKNEKSINNDFKIIIILMPSNKYYKNYYFYSLSINEHMEYKLSLIKEEIEIENQQFSINKVYLNEKEKKCIFCFDNIPNIILMPCFHLILCLDCFMKLNNYKECPICRKNILKYKIINNK